MFPTSSDNIESKQIRLWSRKSGAGAPRSRVRVFERDVASQANTAKGHRGGKIRGQVEEELFLFFFRFVGHVCRLVLFPFYEQSKSNVTVRIQQVEWHVELLLVAAWHQLTPSEENGGRGGWGMDKNQLLHNLNKNNCRTLFSSNFRFWNSVI